MEVFRLAVTGGALALRRDEAERPRPVGHEQVLVEVEAAAVSGPELARASGAASPEPGLAVVGEVVEAGPGADHLVGSRVIGPPVVPCGDCARCRRGLPPLCPSRDFVGANGAGGVALAPYVLARARWLVPLAPPLAIPGPEAALLGREAIGAYALYARAGLAPGQRAVVLGRGAIARICLDILRAQGIGAIAVAGDDAWADVAAAHGAQIARGPAPFDVGALQSELRALAPEEAAGDAPDAILETTGEPAQRSLAVELSRPGSVAVLASRAVTGAVGAAATAVDDAADEGATVLGVAGPHPDLLPEVAALAARQEIDLGAAAVTAPVAEIVPLAETLARGDLPGRAVVAVWSRR